MDSEPNKLDYASPEPPWRFRAWVVIAFFSAIVLGLLGIVLLLFARSIQFNTGT